MKSLIRLLLVVLLLPAAARTQALPEAPSPMPSDPAWNHLKNLAVGAPIVVGVDNSPPVHCLFSAVTDAYLFCSPPENPPGVGFRFDRANVISVDFDLPMQNSGQFTRPKPNYHPAWIASILGGGLIVGICATRTMSDGDSARAGAIGALVVAAIGAPLAFLPQPQGAGFAYPPHGLVGPRFPLFAPHLHPLHSRIR
jgi:hypothetical protein